MTPMEWVHATFFLAPPLLPFIRRRNEENGAPLVSIPSECPSECLFVENGPLWTSPQGSVGFGKTEPLHVPLKKSGKRNPEALGRRCLGLMFLF